LKYISILGSTGSIGTQTLEIAKDLPLKFKVVALSAGRNIDLLTEQVKQYEPEVVAIEDKYLLEDLKNNINNLGLNNSPIVLSGSNGINTVASWESADIVVTGIVGCAGLIPTMTAINAGKNIALANKETLIAAGSVVIPALKKNKSRLLPADSEHSAIFQCLQGLPHDKNGNFSTGIIPNGLKAIHLTASGGAFRDWKIEDLKNVTVKDATSHPNWDMGRKITVDSATLMNKGLEVIEAHYLFGTSYEDIEIVIHPQSIIHSMIELDDSSVLAQLGWPDMKLPILYAMSWPERFKTNWKRLDLTDIGQLTFMKPDTFKYPCMKLAYSAGKYSGTMPAVLNAANEISVEQFLKEQISFLEIPKYIEKACETHIKDLNKSPLLEDILNIDRWARNFVAEEIKKGVKYFQVR
tara:strand:- start:4105 stop:5334 length:1230 start_codon:yes stop_codon:yes gene_type:complete